MFNRFFGGRWTSTDGWTGQRDMDGRTGRTDELDALDGRTGRTDRKDALDGSTGRTDRTEGLDCIAVLFDA